MWEDSRTFTTDLDIMRVPRLVRIFGDIGYPNDEAPIAVTALEVTNDIIELVQRDHHTSITVLINSDGGSVYEGMAMLDAFDEARRHGVKVVTRCVGRAQSMAADLLVCGGDFRTISPNSFVMVHGASDKGLRFGDDLDMESEMRIRAISRERLLDLYEQKTSKPRRYWAAIFKDSRPVFYTPTEAESVGIVDAVY